MEKSGAKNRRLVRSKRGKDEDKNNRRAKANYRNSPPVNEK